MALLKKVLAHPLLKKIPWALVRQYLPWVLVAAGIIVLVAVIILYVRRKRKAAGEQADEKPKEPAIGTSALWSIWKQFTSRIPKDFRRVIKLYQPFVVMGAPGSGKSQLVDKYTDWQGLACQFYPSYVKDPKLQLYLGSQHVVQELSPELLTDTSKPMRKALKKLWKKSLGKRTPTVVIAIDGPALLNESPDAIRRQAQLVRGKINVLWWARKESIATRLVLTRMDEVEGYPEFARFLTQSNIKLDLQIDSSAREADMARLLEPYERYLSLALKTVAADDYLKILAFLSKAPELLSAMAAYAQALCTVDPLSPLPAVEQLNLASNLEDDMISSPFAAAPVVSPIGKRTLSAHRLAAACLFAAGVLFLGVGYYLQNERINEAHSAVSSLESRLGAESEELSDKELVSLAETCSTEKKRFFERKPGFQPRKVFPNFFADDEIAISQRFDDTQALFKRRYVEAIRQKVLLPRYEELGRSSATDRQMLCMLALLYSSSQNELGALVLDNLHVWEDQLNMETRRIRDYIANSDESWPERLVYHGGQPDGAPVPVSNAAQAWLVYSNRLRKIFEQDTMTPEELATIQAELKSLRRYRERFDGKELEISIIRMLEKEASIDLPSRWENMPREYAQLEQRDLRLFTSMIANARLSVVDTKEMTLATLLDNIEAMAAMHASSTALYNFKVARKEFKFQEDRWNRMIEKSRLVLIAREYVRKHEPSGKSIFFSSDDHLEPLLLNPTNDGQFIFTGKVEIDGRYARKGFETKVRPVVERYEKIFADLPIPELDKRQFRKFIGRNIDAYATQYAKAVGSYSKAFRIDADSEVGLRFMLSQMQIETSPFGKFLTTIRFNTQPELGKSELLSPVRDKLADFKFLNNLLLEEKGRFPELEKYFAILKMMESDLGGGLPEGGDQEQTAGDAKAKTDQAAEEETADQVEGLADQLSPLARISLSIYQRTDDSYAALTGKWLKSIGMPEAWQQPFLAPARTCFKLGKGDVQKAVIANWDRMVRERLAPVLVAYPFVPTSDRTLDPTLLTKELGPGGQFWKDFEAYVAPVCKQKGLYWRGLNRLDRIRLPDEMLMTVNRLTDLQKQLWDRSGQPRPIMVKVKPMPLPEQRLLKTFFETAVVLAYLNSGEGSVLAFNQKPDWYNIRVDWWRPHVASVGVQFRNLDSIQSAFSATNTGEKNWAFLRLLSHGQQVRDGFWRWRLSPDEALRSLNPKKFNEAVEHGALPELSVGFGLESSPQELFRLDLPWVRRLEQTFTADKKQVPQMPTGTEPTIQDAPAEGAPEGKTDDGKGPVPKEGLPKMELPKGGADLLKGLGAEPKA